MCPSAIFVIKTLLAFLLHTVLVRVVAINVTITPREQRCFISSAAKGDKIIGSVGLVPSDALAEVALFKVDSNLAPLKLHDQIPALDFNNLSYDVPDSAFYALCLTNRHPDLVTFVLSFRVETLNNKGMSSLSTVEDLKGVITYAERLLTTTREIMERMEAYSTREYLLSKVINKMNTRIVTWSVVQMVVVIGLCCYQIYHISSFFEVKSFV